MNFSRFEYWPSTRISTPPEVLYTQPCKLSRVASPYTNGRNPTPCTTPFTEICLAIIIIVLSISNPSSTHPGAHANLLFNFNTFEFYVFSTEPLQNVILTISAN